MKWLLLAAMVSATVTSDLLQSAEMKRQGEITDFRPGALGNVFGSLLQRWRMIVAVGGMAVSFFSLLQLLRIADLSFAVPASAATYVLETFLAQTVLKEHVAWQRWAGAALVAAGVLLLAA